VRTSLWAVLVLNCIGLLGMVAPAGGDELATLKYSDLVNHPERWPAQVTMKNTLQFNDGSSLAAGTVMKLMSVRSDSVAVSNTGVTSYAVGPDDTDVVDAANALWSKLNADQRHLSLATIEGDASLWPATLKLTNRVSFGNGTNMEPGTVVNFLHFHQGAADNVEFSIGKLEMNWVPYDMTDLIPQARDLVATPRESRPSRIVAQLQGNTVDGDGKAADCPDKGVKYFAFYFSASWCEPCRAFAPQLVTFAKQVGPAHPELAIVMVSQEAMQAAAGQHVSQDYDGDMFKYMKDMGMPWIALPPSAKSKCPNVWGYGDICTGDYSTPNLVVTDRWGTVLASGLDAKAIEQLKKILAGP